MGYLGQGLPDALLRRPGTLRRDVHLFICRGQLPGMDAAPRSSSSGLSVLNAPQREGTGAGLAGLVSDCAFRRQVRAGHARRL